MAVMTIAHKPELTKEQVKEVFRKHFEGKASVEDFRGLFRDFVVIKNPFVGVSVKLDQDSNETKIVYTGYAPAWWARATLGTLLGFMLWNGLTNQVEEVIKTAPEFH